MRILLPAAAILVSILEAYSQPLHINGLRAKGTIEVLASDSLQGRRSGLPGGEKAAAWIAEQFQSFGLKPGVGDTSYFHNFTITTAVESGPMILEVWPKYVGAQRAAPLLSTSDTLNFQYSEDFASFAYGGAGRIQGQLIFVGYGINAPEKGRNDYVGVDLKGKIAIALRGAPDRGEGFWGGEGWHGVKLATAYDAGAAGYLHIGEGKAMQRTVGIENYRKDFPAFWISRQTCDRIFQMVGLTFDSLLALSNAHPKGYHLDLPIEVSMESHAGVIENAPTRNVLAYVLGADSELAHEIVLIGAHMDHLGVNAAGRVLHGADDNASGTAMVMELARTLISDPIPPRRSVYFCTFAAEDLGLMGSEEFTAHPPIPLDNIVSMINLDMVGLGDQGVDMGGWPNFPKIAEIWSAALSDSQKARINHFKPGHSSDHASFEVLGVPAFFVASAGDHPNYHQPEDEAQFIRPETLAEVGDLVYRGLRAVADYPAPLANPNRLTDYLWQSSETAMLGAPEMPMRTGDDHPDLILYEAGKTIDPSSRNRLRRLLVEIEQMDSLLASKEDEIARVDSLKHIPTGRLNPALAVGIASPKLVENEPEIYRTLAKLGVLFIHVPTDGRGSYFGVRGMKKGDRDLLAQLEAAPQQVICDVGSFHQAQQLMDAATRPMVVRIIAANDKETAKSIKLNGNDFLLLSAQVAGELDREQFEALAQAAGWMNLGIEAANSEEATPLLDHWLEWGYKQGKIVNLMGGNMERWLGTRKIE
jgi:hypothetical protein